MTRAQTSVAKRLKAAAPVFAALGDETRLGVVLHLAEAGPQSISKLTEGTEVTRQAVTKHLLALEEAGLVKSAREGRERIWKLETRRLAEAQGYLERISSQWDDAIGRLRRMVEGDPPP